MINTEKDKAILFMDSGVGGISVLKETLKILPNEDYIFFGDTLNAPYGSKKAEELRKITLDNVEILCKKNDIKAIVIACNTITGVAVEMLREKYKNIHIIGVEPAIKPAVMQNKSGNIWVMATERTLEEEKFINLICKYEEERITKIPCKGLMEFVEEGKVKGEEVEHFLKSLLKSYIKRTPPKAIVLGCTHYPFLAESIKKVVGNDVKTYDGGEGTAKRLKEILTNNEILSTKRENGIIKYVTSKPNSDMVKVAKKLINE